MATVCRHVSSARNERLDLAKHIALNSKGDMDTTKHTAEQATGCRENPHGIGQFYAGAINRSGRVSESGAELTSQEARVFLREGGEVAVPNAGAGSYREVFAAL